MHVEKDQIYTVVAIVVVILVGLLAGWMPQNKKINERKAELDHLKSKLSKHASQETDLAVALHKVRDLEERIASQPKRVPSQGELAALLKQVSTHLQSEEVRNQTILTRTMQRGDDFNVMPLRLTFRCEYRSMYSFLRDLEAMPRLMHVSRLEIETASGKSKDKDRDQSVDLLEITMDLNTFFASVPGGES